MIVAHFAWFLLMGATLFLIAAVAAGLGWSIVYMYRNRGKGEA